MDALLIAVQQICQWMLVMDVGGADHRTVGQPALAFYTKVQLHAQRPLLVFSLLVYLGVTGLVRVLGGAGCADDGGIHDSAGFDLGTTSRQFLTDLGRKLFAKLVVIELAVKLRDGRRVRDRLKFQANAYEAA